MQFLENTILFVLLNILVVTVLLKFSSNLSKQLLLVTDHATLGLEHSDSLTIAGLEHESPCYNWLEQSPLLSNLATLGLE